MKILNIFLVGGVLGSLTENEIRRKLYDYQTLTGVDDTVVTDLFRIVFKLRSLCLGPRITHPQNFSETSLSEPS